MTKPWSSQELKQLIADFIAEIGQRI